MTVTPARVAVRTKPGTISPKALMAAVLPTLGGLIAVGVQWLVSGEYDEAELVTSLTAVGAALVSFLGAWAGSPGLVVPVSEGEPMPNRLRGEEGFTAVGIVLAAVIIIAVLILLPTTHSWFWLLLLILLIAVFFF